MPFQDGVYYPYSSDTQGTHSSAGIPSVLSSPLSQPSAPARSMTPSGGSLPFKFRPRRENVDWRRINAVDIDTVVSQVDVDVLQEHVRAVTFCSLAGERCQRCHSPVDPVLVKLLQLAQLSVEWLLHCQDALTLNLQAAEERLAAADREREQLLADAGKEREQLLAHQKTQEERLKEMASELKNRKKIIKTQQSMFPSRIIDRQECPHCDKAFLNASFLQGHVQRRHPEEYEKHLHSDKAKKSQIESLKLEICNLKEQNAQQQQMLQAKIAQEKDQQVMYKELQRDFDRFKAEEMVRVDRKLEENRDVMRREMEYLRKDVNQNQTPQYEKPASPVHSQPERELDNNREMEHQLKKQDKKWKTMLQDMRAYYESEKNQLLNEQSRLQSSVLEYQEQSQSLQQEMKRRLQEKEQTIRAQREQIRHISSNPPTKVVEVPVSAPAPEPKAAPEPKPKRVAHEEPRSAPKLEPIQELSEEEKDLSSISKRRPVEKKPVSERKERVATTAVRMNPSFKKQIRAELERDVIKRMENLRVKPDQTGLKELKSIMAKMESQRESFAKAKPDYWHVRDDIASIVEQKMGGQNGSESASESQARLGHSVQVLQIRPRSSSLPSKASHATSRPAVKQPTTPQPAPRTKSTTQPKTSTPNPRSASRAFTPNSDEESEEEETDMEEEEPVKPQRSKTPQARLNQATAVQVRAAKASTVQTRQPPARHSFSSKPLLSRESAAGVTKTAVTKMESDDDDEDEDDDDWSEVSELQEIDPRKLQSYKDENGNVDKRNIGKDSRINELARKMEKQFAERAAKKPAGGVSILPERKDEVQELSYTDVDESSDWVVSSLEDRQEKLRPAQSSGTAKKSLDSPSTSVWGSSTGKTPKSGLNEAGTGSTLKSSLCFLSDISDSEDISSKHH